MPNTTLAWTLVNEAGFPHPVYKADPGYILIWLMRDWPEQIAQAPETKHLGLRVLSGSACLDHAKYPMKGKRIIRGATAPYLIPINDWKD